VQKWWTRRKKKKGRGRENRIGIYRAYLPPRNLLCVGDNDFHSIPGAELPSTGFGENKTRV